MEGKDLKSETQHINFFDLLIVLLKRKRLIIGGTLFLTILTGVIGLLMTPVYQGTTRIMPPQQNASSTASQLMGQLGGAASMLLGGTLPASSGELYIGLLQSDCILDKIIDRFDIMKRYDAKTRVGARALLGQSLLVTQVDTKSGIITISALDDDPQRAADMANAFVEELKLLLEGIAVTDESKRRLFFEKELKKAHEALSRSEDELKGFQETTGVLKLDDQAAAILQGITSLRSLITAREVQLQVMKTYATQTNPDVKRVEEEIAALKEQYRKLEERQSGSTPDVVIRTGDIPTLGTEYVRKLRDFKYNELLYELLVKQYEAAKLDEARESAIIQVIHPAAPADQKTKPKLILMVVLAFIGGGLLSTLAAFGLEYLENSSKIPENEERLRKIKHYARKL